MAKPTEEQLSLINKLSVRKLTEDECYVFTNYMIDNLPTSYYSIIHSNLLNTFIGDVRKGVALLLVHNDKKLPVGRSFDARLVTEYSEKENRTITSLYGDFYIPYNINFEGGVTSNDIIEGIETGINFATSIGFSAEQWTCSICGNDIRDYEKCPHVPGKEYIVNDEKIKCYVIVGENGIGRLTEDSIVFAGACKQAGIVSNYSENVNDFSNMSKLSTINDFKSIPVGSTLWQYYSQKESVIYLKKDVLSTEVNNLYKRSENNIMLDKIKEITSSYGFSFKNEEDFEQNFSNFIDSKLNEQKIKLETEFNEQKAKLENELNEKNAIIEKLEKENGELSEKAELAERYRKDLIEQALQAGIRCQGNAFPKDTFEKFLISLSVDEIKNIIKDFENQFNETFSPKRITQSSCDSNKKMTREDFETEEEFRAYVAEEALKFSREQKIDLKEATKQLYIKLSKEGE